MDTLTIKGLGNRFDGDYSCDVGDLLTPSGDEPLTNEEARLVKRISGARGNEIGEAFLAGDTDVLMALAIIVASRHGKTLNEEMLLKARIGAAMFDLGTDIAATVEESAEIPPTEGETNPPPSQLPSGGITSLSTWENFPASGQEPIGAHG
jgi:hypothetical protein